MVLLFLVLAGACTFGMALPREGAPAQHRTAPSTLSLYPITVDAVPALHGWQDRNVRDLPGPPDAVEAPTGRMGTGSVVNSTPRQSLQVAGQVMPPLQASEAAGTMAVPASAGSTRHRMTINSCPPGARIFLDGAYTGKVTPFTIDDLAGGNHILRLETGDYTPYEENISLAADTNRTVELYSQYACVRIRALPAPVFPSESHSGGLYLDTIPRLNAGKDADTGAEDSVSAITIDSVAIERSLPLVITGLKEGLHHISLQEQDSAAGERSCDVWVFRDAIVPLVIDRNRVSPPRTVNVSISGSHGEDFTVNGLSPVYRLPRSVSVETSQVGSPFVTVRAEDRYCSLPVTAFDGLDIPAPSLPASFGSLMVDSDPQGAEIFVDGFRTGLNTPYTIRNLSAGSHRIMVSRAGYVPDETILTVYPTLPVQTADFLLGEYTYGTLVVQGPLDGDEILINGMQTGERSPHTFYGMPIGACAVSIRAANKTLFTQDIVLAPDHDNVCTIR
jgi:hypothetical protein